MTSSEIRQSFLDFFKSKQHTIVPSSSLMPDSPNLLFTNAGMNQFVPIFLGQQKADVSKWPGAIPASDTRAADTQKCIRAGGKHNDLEDVGLDTYHHTFFEMLGNWSFGDYFKREAIDWAWELITEVWKFPKNRLYATVYSPDKSLGDPSDFDQEAHDYWAEKFTAAGLDPKVHIVNGNKKDNFWMMGETGPCGPCSELHVDLTPNGDTHGALVNKGSPQCIEIWNLVFIQFNARVTRTEKKETAPGIFEEKAVEWAFDPLPAKHVDTGMGFERVTSIMQGTRNFKDFANAKISNYETDIFRPIFEKLENLTSAGGHPQKYTSTLPTAVRVVGDKEHPSAASEVEAKDIAFRVIADHIRTLSFSIADGILPGNNDRNYVLRRILRRAVKYGRTLGFHQPFFFQLVDVLAEHFGEVFPEIRTRKQAVKDAIRAEEESFNRTLDEGIRIFNLIIKSEEEAREFARNLEKSLPNLRAKVEKLPDNPPAVRKSEGVKKMVHDFYTDFVESMPGLQSKADGDDKQTALFERYFAVLKAARPLLRAIDAGLKPGASEEHYNALIETGSMLTVKAQAACLEIAQSAIAISGLAAFSLYDTYGFPLDLTELMARERGLTVDTAGFEKLMNEQRARARASQKREVISLSNIDISIPTRFIGYDQFSATAKVFEVVSIKEKTGVILDISPFYAEMGGQLGDTGQISAGGQLWHVVNTQKTGSTFIHFLAGTDAPTVGTEVQLTVELPRRNAIQRHHTVTHLFHWALHEVVSHEATQKGSFVGPDKLTFDFNAQPLTRQQLADIEKLVNERILENSSVSWTEIPYSDAKSRKDITHLFGEKYGDRVRVVQIGGESQKLNGYSMELCGGTHTRGTGEIGYFRIVGENAIAAGVRRVEAVAGLASYEKAKQDLELLTSIAGKLNTPVAEIDKKLEALLAHQKELEKQIESFERKRASETAKGLINGATNVGNTSAIIKNMGAASGDFLQSLGEALKGQFKGVAVLAGTGNGTVSLVAFVASDLTKSIQAGKIIQAIAPIVGGKGGGRPDFARGGGKDAAKIEEALAKAHELIAAAS